MSICRKPVWRITFKFGGQIQCVGGFFLLSLIQLAVVVYFSVKMSRYSVSERIFIVRTHYSNNNSPIVTQRKFATEFQLKTTGLSASTINYARYVEKLRNHFIPVIQSEPNSESMLFMQDGASHHRTNKLFYLLEELF